MKEQSTSFIFSIGFLQLAITWYKIRHAGGQAHYYSRSGTLGSLRFDEGNVNHNATNQ